MTDHELALHYAPWVHFDRNETIPLRAVGYTIARKPCIAVPSPSVTWLYLKMRTA